MPKLISEEITLKRSTRNIIIIIVIAVIATVIASVYFSNRATEVDTNVFFENAGLYLEVENYEKTENDKYTLTVRSDFARIGHFIEYDYRADAIASYQFYCFWLTDNEKTVINRG